jgi:hypothetical protein
LTEDQRYFNYQSVSHVWGQLEFRNPSDIFTTLNYPNPDKPEFKNANWKMQSANLWKMADQK